MARGVLMLLLACAGRAGGALYSDYSLANMPHYEYEARPAPPRAYLTDDEEDVVDYPEDRPDPPPPPPPRDYKFDDEPQDQQYKPVNGWPSETKNSINPKRPSASMKRQHVGRYNLEKEVLEEKADSPPPRRRKSRLYRARAAHHRPYRVRADDTGGAESWYSSKRVAREEDATALFTRRPDRLLRRRPRAKSMQDDSVYGDRDFEEPRVVDLAGTTAAVDDEYAGDKHDVRDSRRVTEDPLDQIEDLRRLHAIKKMKTTAEDHLMDLVTAARLQRPQHTSTQDSMAQWWAQQRADLMKDLLPGVQNTARPQEPEELMPGPSPAASVPDPAHRDDLDLWSGQRAALMKKLMPQLNDVTTQQTSAPSSESEVGSNQRSDDRVLDVWTGLKRNKQVDQMMRKLMMGKSSERPPLTRPTTQGTTLTEDLWWAHRRAGILNKLNMPGMKRITTKKITTTRVTTPVLITEIRSTTAATTTATVDVYSDLEMTQSLQNVSEVLSFAEKSRLSILKKALRKESQREVSTKKPPVLMLVTQQVNTVVMVAPAGAQLHRRQMQVVQEDSPQRLQFVKRMMREKLVRNAKNIHQLVDNWDQEVCDYVDMSVLRDADFSASCPRLRSPPIVLLISHIMYLATCHLSMFNL